MAEYGSNFAAKMKVYWDDKEAIQGAKNLETQMDKFNKPGAQPAWLGKEPYAPVDKLKEAMGGVTKETQKGIQGMGDFEKAMRRALIVAPVWMALRAGMQFFVQGIKEGINYLVQMEKQLNSIRQILPQSFDTKALSDLRLQFEALAVSTGKSAIQIAESYKLFLKTGLDAKNAIQGVTEATKLQEVAQSNSADIAKAVALAYKLQGDSLKTATSPAEKFRDISAAFYDLGAKNLTTIEELSKEYLGFAPAAKAANLSFQETIALLATLNSSGIQNVTGLKSAILRLFADMDKVAPSLNLIIPKDMSPFETFVTVLKKISEIAKTGNFEQYEKLKELFGGVAGGRGGAIIAKTLSGAMEELNKNLDATKYPIKEAEEYDKSLKEVNKELGHQLEILGTVKTQIFKTFITGITGGKDYASGVKNVHIALKDLEPTISGLSKLLHTLWSASPPAQFLDSLRKVNEHSEKLLDTEGLNKKALENLNNKRLTEARILEEITKKSKDYAKGTEESDKLDELKRKTQQRLEATEREIQLTKMAATGVDNITIAYTRVQNLVKDIGEEYNKYTIAGKGQVSSLNEQGMITDIISGNFENIRRSLEGTGIIEERLTEIETVRGKLLDAQLQKRKKEEDSLRSLVMQYDKADMFEKGKIRRATELVKLSPEELGRAYEGNKFDKDVIIDYWNSFSEEGRRAIEEIQARLSDIIIKPDVDLQMEAFDRLEVLTKAGKANIYKGGEIYAPPIPIPNQTLTNNYTIPITLQGAITDENIQELLQKIETKVKEQPNYIGDTNLLEALNNPEVKKKVANVAANTNT